MKTAHAPPAQDRVQDNDESTAGKTATLLANAQAATVFLKALAHESRLVILCLLVEGEKTVTELEKVLSLRQPAVSQQLARLRSDNLVETRRHGKNIYYRLARPEVIDIVSALHRAFCEPPSGKLPDELER